MEAGVGMSVVMPPHWETGLINVTPGEVEDARLATEDVELVRTDGTLTEAGQFYVASVRQFMLDEREAERSFQK